MLASDYIEKFHYKLKFIKYNFLLKKYYHEIFIWILISR